MTKKRAEQTWNNVNKSAAEAGVPVGVSKKVKNVALDTVTNPEPTPLRKSGGNIFDRATLIVLNFEGVGNSRKVRTAQLEPQADFSDTVVGANKKLFKCEEFLAIKRNEADTRQFIGRKALPSYFQRGTYLVPNKSIPAVVEKLREIKA